ncbi:MAG: hypothetical protein KAV87_59790 [Desulfobacteraceae bacterium]|nr:hypothetical protein [Desulfobacteraceae bacterium]
MPIIQFVDENLFSAFSLFNGNAYPASVRGEVNAAANQAAMFRYQTRNVGEVIFRDRNRFFNQLLQERGSLERAARKKGEESWIAIYEGAGYLSSLNGAFYSLKSFLDAFAQLMTKLIVPSQKMTFKRATLEGEKLSGGAFVKWLNHSAPKSFSDAGALADVVMTNSREWITEAVLHYRDRLTHDGKIEGLVPMHVLVEDFVKDFLATHIQNPTMPNGIKVDVYCVSMLRRLEDFVYETVQLLPNVDQDLVSRGPFSKI